MGERISLSRDLEDCVIDGSGEIFIGSPLCIVEHFVPSILSGRAAPGSEIHTNGDLIPLDSVAEKAIGVIVIRIQRNAIAQPQYSDRT